MQPENNQSDVTHNLPSKQKNQKKILLALLGIFVVAGVGLAGWKWHGQVQEYKTKQNEADQRISQFETEIKKLKNATADTAENANGSISDNYLDIKNWGVKVKAQYLGLKYVVETQEGGSQAVWFTNTKAQNLFKKYGACGDYKNGLNHFYLGVLTREDSEVDQVAGLTFLKKIDGKYYYYTLSNGGCSDGSDMQVESEARDEIKNTLLTLVKD